MWTFFILKLSNLTTVIIQFIFWHAYKIKTINHLKAKIKRLILEVIIVPLISNNVNY